MELHKIIDINDSADNSISILYESIHPYLKSLYIYYKDYYGCEPFLMVTDVFNAAQYVRIIPEDELYDAIERYLDSCGFESHEERKYEAENILFNSQLLKDILI